MSISPVADQIPRLYRDRSMLRRWCGPQTVVVSSPSALRVAGVAELNLTGSHVVITSEFIPAHLVDADQVIALGSGTTIDAVSLAAHRAALPVLFIPTVLSTDAPFSTVTAAREHGTVVYHETGAADAILFDDQTLLASDWHLHQNGLGDLLAIESASHDWQRLNPGKQVGITAATRALVDAATDEPSIWSHPSSARLELLAELLATKVHLGLLAGHPAFEEGTEHYLAYFLEPYLDGPVWHGELLLACLLVSAYLQEWPVERYKRIKALTTHLPRLRSPVSLVSPDLMHELLSRFPDYCKQHSLNNTVVIAQPPTHDQIHSAVAAWERGW